MLALSTGWTPPAIGSLPAAFRRACHWALFTRAIVGPEGLPEVPDLPIAGVDAEQRIRHAKVRAAMTATRSILFPTEEDPVG